MLETVGSDMDHVLHIHVFLKRIEDFEEMNRAYRDEITGQLPARTVVGVADLPKKGALLTMNLTAVTRDDLVAMMSRALTGLPPGSSRTARSNCYGFGTRWTRRAAGRGVLTVRPCSWSAGSGKHESSG